MVDLANVAPPASVVAIAPLEVGQFDMRPLEMPLGESLHGDIVRDLIEVIQLR